MVEEEGEDSYDKHVRSGISIGKDHFIKFEWLTPSGEGIASAVKPEEGSIKVGLLEQHKNAAGTWCGGYITFGNVPEAVNFVAKFGGRLSGHVLENDDPISVSPSLLCRCGKHGFIRAGAWSDA